ncbi:MAG: hypothetical protein CVV05_00510 [Gammaproteobacteria bacterium HGW-Gammaproteobacteria-1]|jgi:hypothetical protein|nr:MAG: hypothetical protein CVV05_00510 [Gammaproteobacteria bacterium HGW-Gammaproteobacteria-1]
MYVKLGKVTGQQLYSMDREIWHGTPGTAVDVLKRTVQRYSTEALTAMLAQHAEVTEKGRQTGSLCEEHAVIYEAAQKWLEAVMAKRLPKSEAA